MYIYKWTNREIETENESEAAINQCSAQIVLITHHLDLESGSLETDVSF